MGFQNWLISHGFLKPKTVELPPEEKIIKTRKVYFIKYQLYYKTDGEQTGSYYNSVKLYNYDKYLELHKTCNERTIKNTKIINECNDDKFVILDSGVDCDDLVTMKRNQFISCQVYNSEQTESYTE